MLALERRNQILSQLQSEKRVIVSELSTVFGVSEETIRRDLEKLEKEGYAVKSYGGAVIREDVGIDFPFQVRQNQNVLEKQKIAQLTVPFIHKGEHLFLDASSTVMAVARTLKEKDALTVVTNSLEVLVQLADVSDWNVIGVGGEMKPGCLAFVGSTAEEQIRSFFADTFIFSCKALDIEVGPTESQPAMASAKRQMLLHSKRRILAADSSKFGKVSFARSCSQSARPELPELVYTVRGTPVL